MGSGLNSNSRNVIIRNGIKTDAVKESEHAQNPARSRSVSKAKRPQTAYANGSAEVIK